MSVEVSCRCGRRFQAAAHLYGRRVACPVCGSEIAVPDPRRNATPCGQVAVACSCGRRFAASRQLLGTQVVCPACKRPFLVQEMSEVMAGPPPLGAHDPLWDRPVPARPVSRTLQTSGYTPAPRRGKKAARTPGAQVGGLSPVSRMLIGAVAAICAVCFLAVAPMAGEITRGGPWVLYAISAIFGVVAVASFVRESHPVTLRIIGAVVFLSTLGVAANCVRTGETRTIVSCLLFGTPAAYLMIMGRFPSWGPFSSVFND